MSSTLKIAISPSARVAAALCAVHVAVAGACWAASIPIALKAGLALAIGLSLVWALSRKAALQSAESVVALEIADDGRISLQTRSGARHECELLPSSYVSPRLTILNLKLQGGRVRHVLLVPDNVDAREFRRLRTWLRWSAQADARPGAGNA